MYAPEFLQPVLWAVFSGTSKSYFQIKLAGNSAKIP